MLLHSLRRPSEGASSSPSAKSGNECASNDEADADAREWERKNNNNNIFLANGRKYENCYCFLVKQT